MTLTDEGASGAATWITDNYYLRMGTPPFCWGKVLAGSGTELPPSLKLRTSTDVVGFVRRSRRAKQGTGKNFLPFSFKFI